MSTVTVEPAVIGARKVRASLEAILDPGAPEWGKADETAVGLEPTPLDRQPSAYVQVAWRDRPRATLREARVRALVTGSAVALRLEWAAARPVRLIDDVNVFADACAVLFPADGQAADLDTMGSPRRPVVAWHWRAGTDEAFSVVARGLGTVERDREHEVVCRARWVDGRWQVVLARPLRGEGVPLEPGATVPVGFAVWCGAARERAGLKSHTPRWQELRLGGGR
ncbi:MAG: ethylbenzene dehydrogenase-related protein [Acidimicrobiia bacterium]|nr:ethylbenzene dehydrogenase-related protein [Acidimicrobiia bacterium]